MRLTPSAVSGPTLVLMSRIALLTPEGSSLGANLHMQHLAVRGEQAVNGVRQSVRMSIFYTDTGQLSA